MKTTIKNVHVFDGEWMTEPQDMGFDDGCLVGSAANADIEIDGTGLSLLPGFIDTHIHIDRHENCLLAARADVTTLIDQMCNQTELIDSLREPCEPICMRFLRATTCEAAKVFGLSDRGSIEPGKRADLLLVVGDPLEDITAVRNI